MQKHKLSSQEKRRLADLDKLANELTPTFSKDDERALAVIRGAARLLNTPKK